MISSLYSLFLKTFSLGFLFGYSAGKRQLEVFAPVGFKHEEYPKDNPGYSQQTGQGTSYNGQEFKRDIQDKQGSKGDN